MLILITYDVKVTAANGSKRLRHISNLCKDYGIRVQYSVFECEISPAQWVTLKADLLAAFDEKIDSLRFYYLGANWKPKVEHYGTKHTPDLHRDAIIL